jgi:hypothetical protein
MFTVFLVCANGHAIKIGECKFEENAIELAKYHFVWSKLDAHFEVCKSGKTVFRIGHDGIKLD